MSLELQWNIHEENGMRIRRDSSTPLLGNGSLFFTSVSDDYTTADLRKSASVALKDADNRGYTYGRFRTLVRRSSSDQTQGWSGVYIMSDIEGIGTFFDPAQSMYQLCDRDGNLRIFKYINSVPSLLVLFGSSFQLGVTHGLEVIWSLSSSTGNLSLQVKLGTLSDFSDLATLGTYVDTDPIATSLTEGFFAQTVSHNHVVEYRYDNTKLYHSTLL